MPSYLPKSITASRTILASDAGTVLDVNAAAGLTLTLPAASGTGRVYDIVVGTTITSNNLVIQVANGSDIMSGTAINAADGGDTAVMFETGASDDTITMNGSTKGGIKGDAVRLVDVATNRWHVSVRGSATSSEITPFSAAVS